MFRSFPDANIIWLSHIITNLNWGSWAELRFCVENLKKYYRPQYMTCDKNSVSRHQTKSAHTFHQWTEVIQLYKKNTNAFNQDWKIKQHKLKTYGRNTFSLWQVASGSTCDDLGHMHHTVTCVHHHPFAYISCSEHEGTIVTMQCSCQALINAHRFVIN